MVKWGLFLLGLVLGVAGCEEKTSEWDRWLRKLAGWSVSSVEVPGVSAMLRV